MLIRARMRATALSTEICVRNVSTRGMLLQACRPPSPGSYVEIILPEARIVARVVWASDRRFGVATRERIQLADFIGPAAREPDRARVLRSARHARAAALAMPGSMRAETTARAMQFLFLILCGAAAAAAVAGLAYAALSGVRENLVAHL